MLPEVGAIVSMEDKQVIILDLLPLDSRAKEYQSVNLQNGDKLLMLNGKRIGSVEILKELYSAIKTGEEVKFGIRRENSMRMVSYKKGDEEAGGQMKVMTMTSGGKESDMTFTQHDGSMNINIDGDAEGMRPILELGLIIGEEAGRVKILETLPTLEQAFPENKPQKNDIVSAINGKPVKAADEFMKIFDNTKIGDEISLDIERDGKTLNISIKKTKSEMKVMTIGK